jgi:hypothetical protein
MMVKLLFHARGDFHWSARDQRQRGDQRFQLDVGFGSEAAAEQRHPDAHLVLWPAEQSRDLKAYERRHLTGRINGDRVFTWLDDRHKWFERRLQRGGVAKRPPRASGHLHARQLNPLPLPPRDYSLPSEA